MAPPTPARSLAALGLLAVGLGGCGSMQNHAGLRTTTDERECLARAMYFESNRSSPDGQLAVGTVVMNRLENPAYPKTICGVVGQKNQFAPGAMTEPMTSRATPKVFKVADAVLAGARHPAVGKAMFFHTAGYRFPYKNMHYVTLAGGNMFYDKRRNPTQTQTMVAGLATSQQRIALAALETPIPSRPGTLFDFTPIPAATPVVDSRAALEDEVPAAPAPRVRPVREPAPARVAPVVVAEAEIAKPPRAAASPIRVAALAKPAAPAKPVALAFKPASSVGPVGPKVATRAPAAKPDVKIAAAALPPARPGKGQTSFSRDAIQSLLSKYDAKKDGKPTRVSSLRRTVSDD